MGAVVVLSLGLAMGGVAVASTTQKSLPKKTYIKAGDSICRQANLLINRAAVRLGSHPSADQLAAFASEVKPTFQQEVDSLRALPKPKADVKKLRKLYKLVKKGYDKIVADPSLLLTGSPPELAKAATQARAYGFTICGTGKT
jgi:esterase/lipase